MSDQSSNQPAAAQAQASPEYAALEQEFFRWATTWLTERQGCLVSDGGAEDCHNVLRKEFRNRADKLGIYLSDQVIDKKVSKWIRRHLFVLTLTDTQRECARARSLEVRRAKQTPRQYRAHVLRHAGLSKAAIARELGVDRQTIYSDLKIPFATVQAKRRRLTAAQKPRPRPKLHIPAKRKICSPWVLSFDSNTPTTTKREQILHLPTPPTNIDRLPTPPPEMDPLEELKKHWNQHKTHISHNAPPDKPPP